MKEWHREAVAAGIAFAVLLALGAEFHDAIASVAMAGVLRLCIRRYTTGRWGFS